MLFVFLSLVSSNPPPMFSWPPRYTIRGTWNVPYTNLSNPMTIVHEPNRQYTNQLNGAEEIWSTTAEEHIHRKIVGAGDKFICYGYNKTVQEWDIDLVKFLPDPEGYVAQEGLYSYRGKSCNLYIKTLNTEKTQTWKMYTDNETGYPVGYVAQAISIFSSHYDVYILNIDEFIPEALPGVWTFPIMCQNADLLPDDPYPYSQMNLFFPGKGTHEAFKKNVEALRSRKVISKDSNHIPPRFSHMDQDTFRKMILAKKNFKKSQLKRSVDDVCRPTSETEFILNSETIDTSMENFSWRENKDFIVVGPPRDQVACGSCWAFSTAELLESAFAIKSKSDSREVSVNQLMDCTWEGDNFGCQGGEVAWALSVLSNKSLNIAYEKDYPYLGLSGLCESRYMPDKQDPELEYAGKLQDCFHVPKTREMIKKALVKFGPLGIGINVVESMSLYVSGAFNDTTCTGASSDLVHAVLLTGWKVIDGIETWEVKNSWSTYWGDEGYVYIQSEYPEWNCGVTTDAVAATVELPPRRRR
ncbi:hypothetical protein M9Y10_023259 [Tritrichomonas musculus]|uniref:Peptidase C1A papain C-terminal domain-containing protein n=1 Tax=Tritrichomonas musculus TaxID=1915356 RepID=A0ABR2KUX3_9EUKA